MLPVSPGKIPTAIAARPDMAKSVVKSRLLHTRLIKKALMIINKPNRKVLALKSMARSWSTDIFAGTV
jgi:hypothetical protein